MLELVLPHSNQEIPANNNQKPEEKSNSVVILWFYGWRLSQSLFSMSRNETISGN
jgi:hypothetical protein